MKKNVFSVFVLSFLLVFLVNSYSQIEIKPTIGLNFTSFSEDPATGKTSANVGWQLGATISGGDKFYYEGGVLWVYKSNKYSADTTNFEFDTKLSGIRIPVSVGYHLLGKETEIIGLRIFGGGSV